MTSRPMGETTFTSLSGRTLPRRQTTPVMSNSDERTITDLQRRIIHAIASDPERSTSSIAEQLDCSLSYVNRVSNDFSESVERIQEFPSLNYMPSFGHPYSIFLLEEKMDQYHLKEGDTLQLTFRIDGDLRRTYGIVGSDHDFVFEQELRARANGAFRSLPSLQEEGLEGFAKFETVNSDHARLSTDRDFRDFLDAIGERLHWQLEDNIGIIVGVGIIEIIHGERDPNALLSTPQFKLERAHFPDYFLNRGPDLVDVQLYQGPVSEPEDVYFSYYGERLDETQKRELRETILDYEVFASTWNYALPGYRGVVGPTTLRPTDDVLRVTDESLNLVEGVRQTITLFEDDQGPFEQLTPERVKEAILRANPKFSLPSTTRYSGDEEQLPLRRVDDRIYLLFDQVTIVLTVGEDRIVWEYPQGISHVEKMVSAVTDMIQQQLELQTSENAPTRPQLRRIDIDDWVFDTNALYHDHSGNRPTSILHTVFTHRFFDSSTIHVPWAVLYEMNKHPEAGSASEAVNKQGFENLRILRTLEELGWLEALNVQTPPETVETDLAEGDVADMQILGYAAENHCCLLSGDRSLIDIANLADTHAVDISQLDVLQATEEDESKLEEILATIGDELHTVSEVEDALEQAHQTGATIPEIESSTPHPAPSAVIEGWESDGSIVRFIRSVDGEECVAPCQPVTLVPTKSVLEFLPSFLDSSDPPLLTDEFLETVAEGLSSLAHDELPAVTLRVPSEYIVQMSKAEQTPSDFNQGLINLVAARNIEYETEPAVPETGPALDGDYKPEQSELLSWDDYLALCLSIKYDDAQLLVDTSPETSWKFYELFGVGTVTIADPTEDE